MRLFKLSIFSLFLFILFIPTALTTWGAISSISMKHPNIEFVNSEYFATGDHIGFYTDWCKKNYPSTNDDKEALTSCIDAELQLEGGVAGLIGFAIIGCIILLPLFLLTLFFYVRWIRRNYSRAGASTRT